jgi:hypothetical protein
VSRSLEVALRVVDREPAEAADPTTAPSGRALRLLEDFEDGKTVPSSSDDEAWVRFKQAEEFPPRSRGDRRFDLGLRVALPAAEQAPSLLQDRPRGMFLV